MAKVLKDEKVAILVANGFNESEMTNVQKHLQKAGANTRIISVSQGLVNSWRDNDWGHHFAADNILSASLAVDYAMLYVPGGKRSIEKLRLTAHTKRFINGFLNSDKPVAMSGDAIELVFSSNNANRFEISIPENLRSLTEQDECKASGRAVTSDGPLLTCLPELLSEKEMAQAITNHFAHVYEQELVAAA